MSKGANTLAITLRSDVQAKLNTIIQNIGERAGQAIRPAAQAGAEVLYRAVRQNVVGRPTSKTGNLQAGIYQVYSKDNSVDKHAAEYHVSWNAKKAPHGHLVEYGHDQPYVVYRRQDGQFRTAVHPNQRGKPPPKGKGAAAKAARDAYYVPSKTAVPVKAYPFVRPVRSKVPEALQAMIDRALAEFGGQRI